MVKTTTSNAGGMGLTPGQGTKVPHAVRGGQIFFLKMVSKSLMESLHYWTVCLVFVLEEREKTSWA